MNDQRPKRISNQRFFDLPLGFLAAVAVHALLFIGFTFVFQWRTEPESVYAELWAPEDASGASEQSKIGERPPTPEDAPDPLEEEQKKLQAQRLEEERKAEKKNMKRRGETFERK